MAQPGEFWVGPDGQRWLVVTPRDLGGALVFGRAIGGLWELVPGAFAFWFHGFRWQGVHVADCGDGWSRAA